MGLWQKILRSLARINQSPGRRKRFPKRRAALPSTELLAEVIFFAPLEIEIARRDAPMLELLLTVTLNLQGTWTKPCQLTPGGSGQTEALQIEGDLWTRETLITNDPLCRGGHFLVIRHQWNSRLRAAELDMTTTKVTYQPLSAGQAAWMRASEFCGIDSWETDIETEVTGLTCEGFQMPAQGQITYSKLEVEPVSNPRLLLGKKTEGFDGTTPATRFQMMESLQFVKSQF